MFSQKALIIIGSAFIAANVDITLLEEKLEKIDLDLRANEYKVHVELIKILASNKAIFYINI